MEAPPVSIEQSGSDEDAEQHNANQPRTMHVGPQNEERDKPPASVDALPELFQDVEFDDQADPSHQQRAWPKRNGSQPYCRSCGNKSSLGVFAAETCQSVDAEQDQLCLAEHDEVNAANAKPLPAEVIGQLAQPRLIDPARAGRGKGVDVAMHNRVRLHKNLGVAQVPPDIRISDAAAIEDEYAGRNGDGEKNREREDLLPDAPACEGTQFHRADDRSGGCTLRLRLRLRLRLHNSG